MTDIDNRSLTAITEHLDRFFDIDAFPPDRPFAGWVPKTYEDAGLDPADWLEPQFIETGHGLMIANSAEVDEINTIVFVSDETLEKAMARTDAPQLLVTHHPLDFETSGRGFLPPSTDVLEAIRNRKVSVYAIHTPLDVHRTISTGMAWAQQLGLRDVERFLDIGIGLPYAIAGALPAATTADGLTAEVARICSIERPNRIVKRRHVSTVAILAGGSVPSGLLEAERHGVDAIVTGTYYNQCQNGIGAEQRAEFDAMIDDFTVTLIECSHYASEAVVMRHDLLEYCRRFGLPGTFVGQDDPWH